MKGSCLIWSRGRHFSPSLLGDRYLKLGSKSDLRAEISGNIVWYDALAPRPEVLRSISCIYANQVLWVLSVTLLLLFLFLFISFKSSVTVSFWLVCLIDSRHSYSTTPIARCHYPVTKQVAPAQIRQK